MKRSDLILPRVTAEQEEAIAGNYLARLAEQHPDKLPLEIFTPLAKLMVLTTVEVGLLKRSTEDENRLLVLLSQRPSSDKFWPNQWHIPGSIIRARDPVADEHDYTPAISRVMAEVGGDIQIVQGPLEYETVRRLGLRGSEVTVRLLAEVEGDPTNGAFFDAAEVLRRPPDTGLLESHSAAIEKVAATYRSLTQ